MNTNKDCINCILKKADERYSILCTDENKKAEFCKKVSTLLKSLGYEVPSPYLSKRINDLINSEFGEHDNYIELKRKYNNIMLEAEDELYKNINSSDDRLIRALKYAMVGNLIDFAAHNSVTPELLDELIKTADNQSIPQSEYVTLKSELSQAKNLVYICDNAGEIVFDKLCIKTLKNLYKDLNITAVVRGKPVFNDATLKDAEDIGLDKIVTVIDNGTDIPGTYLREIDGFAKAAIDDADIIISKGQGNFETLFGCGKNIYYLFLCKCDHFISRFNVPMFTGMFVNERRTKI